MREMRGPHFNGNKKADTMKYSSKPKSPPGRYAGRSSGASAYCYGDSSSSVWGLSDPEMKRKKRVASYKAYGVEGKMKASVRDGFRWIKNKYSQLIHGY